MSKPAAVVFDYGQVLSLPQSRKLIDAMAVYLGAGFEKHYWDLREPYDRGDILGQEYWQSVSERCGVPYTSELGRVLTDLDVRSWSGANEAMVRLAVQLKESGVKLGILSNMPFELRASVAGADFWLPDFDHETFSCEVRCVKPARQIYDHCLSGLGLPPEQVLFVDDRQENIAAARSIGMRTVWVVDAGEALQEIAAIFSLPTHV